MLYNPKMWYWNVDEKKAIYSSAGQGYVQEDDPTYSAWLAAGNLPTNIDTEVNLFAVLKEAGVPPHHRVSTYTVVQRLQAAGKLAAANAALESDLFQKTRFYTVGFIDADNPESVGFLQLIGADPSVILAPEGS